MAMSPLIPQPYATPNVGVSPVDGYLKGLAIGNYVFGGLTALFSCFGFIYIAMGIAALNGAFVMPPASTMPNGPQFPKEFFGWMFIALGSIIILLGVGVAVLSIIAGRRLQQQRWWGYCLAIAIVQLLSFPFGTTLGVLTMIVILGDAGKARFKPASMVMP